MAIFRYLVILFVFSLVFTGCQQNKTAQEEIEELQKEQNTEVKVRTLFSKYQSEKLKIINEEKESSDRSEKDQKLLDIALSYQSDFETLKVPSDYEDDLKLIIDYFQAEVDYYKTEIELEKIKKERRQTNVMTSREAKKMIELLDKSEIRYTSLDKLQSEVPYIFTEQP